jgi:hypothetical protein
MISHLLELLPELESVKLNEFAGQLIPSKQK